MFRVTRAEEQAVRLIMRLAVLGEQLTLSDLAADFPDGLEEPDLPPLRYSHGGTGFESTHSPSLALQAATSASASLLSLEYAL